jgi:ribosomal protein S18 acetylase RimI-like enzyme
MPFPPLGNCTISRVALDISMATITTYGSEHFPGVDALWRDAFPNDSPWNVAAVAIPEKIKTQPNLLLVAVQGQLVVGSVMAGYEGHRGWISRIAVLRSHQRKGIGQALIAEAEKRLERLGCIKINLQVVSSNSSVVGFYRRLGYAVEERISMSKRISPRR